MKYNLLMKIQEPNDLKKLEVCQLPELAQEIRDFLIENITQTGGHLAPNLGVVELTIALHYVFDSPKDCLLWDVGHQSYVHKILTGRYSEFPKLRKKNGLSGYPSPQESIHDKFHAGHSATSISLGVGIASAKKINNDKSATIAIIGDGSFTGGMVYEALNDASWRKVPLLIVLNDNKMSISENVGGIVKHLDTLRANKTYLSLKKNVYDILNNSSIGEKIIEGVFGIKSYIKKIFFHQANLFENLGVRYLGPFDGHNIKQIITIFEQIKTETSPTLIHILTHKGYGYHDATSNPIDFHGISGISDNSSLNSKKNKSWSKCFGEIIQQFVEKDSDIMVITAAMREGTGLVNFANQFPSNYIDVGIAEQHAVTLAAGLAIEGKKPIVAIYSTFLQRAYDQLLHDIAIGNLPVIFCLDRAGLVPGDGKTHQGVFDISYLRTIPNMTIMSPLTCEEFYQMIEFALNLASPVAIRYSKDICPTIEYNLPPIRLGEGIELEKGKDGIIILLGSLIEEIQYIKNELNNSQIDLGIYHLRFAKPISENVLVYLRQYENIILIEEGIQIGGVGEFLQNQLRNTNNSILLKNIGDNFPNTDTRQGLLEEYQLIGQNLINEIKNFIKKTRI